jgi:FMN phosphatase YigB (HAD superfamily)
MIKIVFFDVANTLLYKPDLIPNIKESLRLYGHDLSSAEIRQKHQELTELMIFPDATSKEFYQSFNSKLIASLGIESSDELVDAIYSSCMGLSWNRFKDTTIIDKLKVSVGIGSNWDNSLKVKIQQYFETNFMWILVSEEIGVKKPDQVFFEKMIEISGYEPTEIMFVGDSMRLDIIPSLQMGIKAVLIDRTNFYKDYKGLKINSMDQLKNLL